jgi:branched-subunit amino acid permease
MSTNPLIIVIYQSIYIYIMYILAAADSTLYRKVGSFFEGKKKGGRSLQYYEQR